MFGPGLHPRRLALLIDAAITRCKLDLTGAVVFSAWVGEAKFIVCDFSGSEPTPIVAVTQCFGGHVEFLNCKYPASHALTAGTSSGLYRISNYSSDYTTSLGSTDLEQLL